MRSHIYTHTFRSLCSGQPNNSRAAIKLWKIYYLKVNCCYLPGTGSPTETGNCSYFPGTGSPTETGNCCYLPGTGSPAETGNCSYFPGILGPR